MASALCHPCAFLYCQTPTTKAAIAKKIVKVSTEINSMKLNSRPPWNPDNAASYAPKLAGYNQARLVANARSLSSQDEPAHEKLLSRGDWDSLCGGLYSESDW
jgi:hypothetical protein